MRITMFAAASLAVLLSPAGATLADVVTLTAARDAAIYEESDTTANGAGDYIFAGNNDNASTRRSLLAFDLTSIPPGSTIQSVSLGMYMSRTQAGNTAVALHRLTAAWSEGPTNPGGQEGRGRDANLGDVTWRYRTYDPGNLPGSPQWSALGGDYVAGSSASTSVGGIGSYSWTSLQMGLDVQGWLDSPATNHGWILRGVESGQKTAKRFNSRESNTASQRPILTVNFTPPSLTGACCFPGESCQDLGFSECNGAGGSFQGDGTSCATTTCTDPVGACCSPTSPWGCTEISQFDCDGQGASYQGDGTLCAGFECPVVLEPFVDALPIPGPAQPVSGAVGGAATYHIVIQELQQQLHSDLPATTVWGYGAAPDPFDPAVTYASYPGPTIEAATGQPVRVRYFNELRDTSLGGSPPPYRTDHYLPVPGTTPAGCIHGADGTPKAVVHLHGGHVEAAADGYPEATFLPGEEAAICVTAPTTQCNDDAQCPAPSRCDGDGAACGADADCAGHGGAENCLLCEAGYEYPNDQPPANIWFHDHALGQTRLNVYMGTAALYMIRDAFEASLGLPACTSPAACYEVPLVIQDRSFHADGGWKYPADWQENFFGDTVLVNGKVWPYLEVAQGKYRFRLLNGSNSRAYTLRFERQDQPGALPFQAIGTDGGLLPAPVPLTEVTLGPAERSDVIVDFEALPPGTEVVLTNSAVTPGPLVADVMKFIVVAEAGFTGAVPDPLRPMEVLDPADAVRTRQFLLRKGSDECTEQRWEIKTLSSESVEVGSRWDDITEFPQLGTTEIWEFANPTVVPHPMHMHLVFFQILNRQTFDLVDDEIVPTGTPTPPAPEEAGWKDTARTEPGELLRVIARFEDYAGLYAYHCHILEHEDHEMMRQFRTVDGVSLIASATELGWSEVAGATGYDVVRGDLATLVAGGGDFTASTEACVLNGQPDLSYDHATDPPLAAGEGYWYLSRTRDAVGNGTFESGSSSQAGHRDAEIEASGVACP
jgi:spore coat protein A